MIKKKLPYKEFEIDCGSFDNTIKVIITKDVKRAASCVNIGQRRKEGEKVNESNFDCLGLFLWSTGYKPVIWLPSFPKTPRQYGTLSHEVYHAIGYISRWAGFPLNQSTEEPCAHLFSYLIKQIHQKGK